MRRAALITAGLLILAVLGSPLAGRVLAPRTYDDIVIQLASVEIGTQGVLRIQSEELSPGWLSTLGRMRVDVGMPTGTETFHVRHVIHHGPIPYSRFDRGFALAVIESSIEELVTEKGTPAVKALTVIGFGGDQTIEVNGVPAQAPGIDWRGGRGRIRIQRNGESLTGKLEMPRLAVQRSGGDLLVEQLVLAFELRAAPASGLSLGAATYSVGQLRAQSADLAFAARGVSWAQRGELDAAGRFNSGLKLRFAALALPQGEYRNGALELTMRNLEPRSALALAQLSNFAMRSVSASPLETGVILSAQLPMLFAAPTELQIPSARIETPSGPLDLTVQVATPAADVEHGTSIGTPPRIAARLSVPEPLFDTFVSIAARWVAADTAVASADPETQRVFASQLGKQILSDGYVTAESDGRLASELVLEQGVLRANGKQLDKNSLLQQMMMTLPGFGTPSYTPYTPPYDSGVDDTQH